MHAIVLQAGRAWTTLLLRGPSLRGRPHRSHGLLASFPLGTCADAIHWIINKQSLHTLLFIDIPYIVDTHACR